MESFWKEYTISLPAEKEYIYDIQNKDINCVFIRNYNITNVNIGVSPLFYEKSIIPNQIGSIARPFPLNYVYLFAVKSTPVDIIETKLKNVDNFIQQQVTKNIIIQNAPKIDVTPVYKLNTPTRIRFCMGPRERRQFTFDLGEYGRTNINLHVYGHAFCFRRGIRTYPTIIFWCYGSNDNKHFFNISPQLTGSPVSGIGYFRAFKNFPYRFLRLSFVTGTALRSRTIFLKISFSRWKLIFFKPGNLNQPKKVLYYIKVGSIINTGSL